MVVIMNSEEPPDFIKKITLVFSSIFKKYLKSQEPSSETCNVNWTF